MHVPMLFAALEFWKALLDKTAVATYTNGDAE